ncbi:unnamed protein product [Owenia fusiformis]|uniref:Uncharacterized protein n=1 Tax=Owenia fusiformis TaxID=6347 RepID=A0A8J1Y8X8_OWEFU|nr:unnamed protein product [Owenia fusiformis]
MAALEAESSAYKCDGCNQGFSEERNFMLHALSCIDLAELDKKAGRPKRSYDIAAPAPDIPKTDNPPGISMKDSSTAGNTAINKADSVPSKDTSESKPNIETASCEPQTNNNIKSATQIEKTNLGATAQNIGPSDNNKAAIITTGDIKHDTPIKDIAETSTPKAVDEIPKVLQRPGNKVESVVRFSSKDFEKVSNNSGTDSDTTIPDRDTPTVNTSKKRKIYNKGKGLDSIVQKLTSSIAHKTESKKLSESLTPDNSSKSASVIPSNSGTTTIPEKIVPTTIADKTVPKTNIPDKTVPTTDISRKSEPTTNIPDKSVPPTTIADKGVATTKISDKSVPTTKLLEKGAPATKTPDRNETKSNTDNKCDILPGKSVTSVHGGHLNASSGEKATETKTSSSSLHKMSSQKKPDVSKSASDNVKSNGKNIFESIKSKDDFSKYEQTSGTSKTSRSDVYSHYMSPGPRSSNMTPFDIVEMVYRPSLASEENIARRSPVLGEKIPSSKGSVSSKPPPSSSSPSGFNSKKIVPKSSVSETKSQDLYRSSISKDPLGRSESPRMISLLHSSKAPKSPSSDVKVASSKSVSTYKTSTAVKQGPSVGVKKNSNVSSVIDKPSMKSSSSASGKHNSFDSSKTKSVESSKSKSVESSKFKSVEISKPRTVESNNSKYDEISKSKSLESSKLVSVESSKPKSDEISKSKSLESSKPKTVEISKSKSDEISKSKSVESSKLKTSESSKLKSSDGESKIIKPVTKKGDGKEKATKKEDMPRQQTETSKKSEQIVKKLSKASVSDPSTSGFSQKKVETTPPAVIAPPVLDAPQLDQAKDVQVKELKSGEEPSPGETNDLDNPPTLEKFDPLKKFKCIKCNFIAYSVTDFAKHLSNLAHIKGVKKFEALRKKEKAKKVKEKLKKGKVTKAKELRKGKLKEKKLKAIVKKQLKSGKILKTKTKTSNQVIANKVKKAALKAKQKPNSKTAQSKAVDTTPKQETTGVKIGTPMKNSNGFKCSHCDSWSTPSRPTYNRHMMSQHDVLMSDFFFSCTYCELRTTDGYDFNRHINTTRHHENAPKSAGKTIERYKITAEEAQSTAFTQLKSPSEVKGTSTDKNKGQIKKNVKYKKDISAKTSKLGKSTRASKDPIIRPRGRPKGSMNKPSVSTKQTLKFGKTKSKADDLEDDDDGDEDDIVLSKLASGEKEENSAESNKEIPKPTETEDDNNLSAISIGSASSDQDTTTAINEESDITAKKSTLKHSIQPVKPRGLKSLSRFPVKPISVKAKKNKFMKKEIPKRRSTRSGNAQQDDIKSEGTVDQTSSETKEEPSEYDTEDASKSVDKRTSDGVDDLTDSDENIPKTRKFDEPEDEVSDQINQKSEDIENESDKDKAIGNDAIESDKGKTRKGRRSKNIKTEPTEIERIEPKDSVQDDSETDSIKEAGKIKQGEPKTRKRRIPIELPPLTREIKKRNVNSIYMRPARPTREAKSATSVSQKKGKQRVDARNELFEKNDGPNGKKGTNSNGRTEKPEPVPVTRYFRKDIEAKLKRKFVLQAQNKKAVKRGMALRKKVEKPIARLTRTNGKPQVKSAPTKVKKNTEKIKSIVEDLKPVTVEKTVSTPEKNVTTTPNKKSGGQIIYKCTMCAPSHQSKNRYDFTRHLNSKLHISNAEKIPGALDMVALDFVISGTPRTLPIPTAKHQMKPRTLLKTTKSQLILNKAKLKANQRVQKSILNKTTKKQKLSDDTSVIPDTVDDDNITDDVDVKPKARGRKRMAPPSSTSNENSKKAKRGPKKQTKDGSDTGKGSRKFSIEETVKLVSVTKPDEEDLEDLQPDPNEDTDKNTLHQQIETQNMAHNLSNIANGNLVSTDAKASDVAMETVELNDDSFEDSWRNALKAENDIDISERNATLFFSDMDTQVEKGDLINVDKSCILYAKEADSVLGPVEPPTRTKDGSTDFNNDLLHSNSNTTNQGINNDSSHNNSETTNQSISGKNTTGSPSKGKQSAKKSTTKNKALKRKSSVTKKNTCGKRMKTEKSATTDLNEPPVLENIFADQNQDDNTSASSDICLKVEPGLELENSFVPSMGIEGAENNHEMSNFNHVATPATPNMDPNNLQKLEMDQKTPSEIPKDFQKILPNKNILDKPIMHCSSPGCNFKATNKTYIVRHEATLHHILRDGVKYLSCEKCNYVVMCQSELDRHLKSKWHLTGEKGKLLGKSISTPVQKLYSGVPIEQIEYQKNQVGAKTKKKAKRVKKEKIKVKKERIKVKKEIVQKIKNVKKKATTTLMKKSVAKAKKVQKIKIKTEPKDPDAMVYNIKKEDRQKVWEAKGKTYKGKFKNASEALRNKETGLFHCLKCPFKTNVQGSYNRHMVSFHNVNAGVVYECPLCDLRTTQRYDFGRHLLSQRHQSLAVLQQIGDKPPEYFKVINEDAMTPSGIRNQMENTRSYKDPKPKYNIANSSFYSSPSPPRANIKKGKSPVQQAAYKPKPLSKKTTPKTKTPKKVKQEMVQNESLFVSPKREVIDEVNPNIEQSDSELDEYVVYLPADGNLTDEADEMENFENNSNNFDLVEFKASSLKEDMTKSWVKNNIGGEDDTDHGVPASSALDSLIHNTTVTVYEENQESATTIGMNLSCGCPSVDRCHCMDDMVEVVDNSSNVTEEDLKIVNIGDKLIEPAMKWVTLVGKDWKRDLCDFEKEAETQTLILTQT